MRVRFFVGLILGVLALSLAPRASAQAQSPIVVTSQTQEITFPKNMRFAIQAHSVAPIQVLRLTVWQRGVALGSRHTPKFNPDTNVRASFEWNFQLFGDGGYLPPGTHGEYTWHIEDSAGNVLDTPRTAYFINDTTQKWQVLADDRVRVSWHVGDEKFGQAIFARALSARAYLSNQLGIANVDPLEIYIYADRQEFFDSLPAFSAEWTGGRMFPEYGVIMINFGPDNLDWGLRATSHELSHAILHSKIKGILGELALPHWLDEGLAVYNETDDHTPDDQFEEAYQIALRRNNLIPLRKLQDRFPDDSNQAQLAYGESYAAVKFMVDTYGEAKFAELLNTYQNGALPNDGLLRVYGMNQDQIENAWRAKIGAPQRDVTVFEMPTIAAQPTFEFSSPLASNSTSTPSASPQPTLEPTLVSVNDTPSTAIPDPAQVPAPDTGVCGGVLAFGGLVTFSLLKRRRR